MKIITVTNLKGGVGKTTVLQNLAGVLLERGSRVLLVDLDKQTNLTATYAKSGYSTDDGPGIYQALKDEIPFKDILQETHIPKLALLPGEWDLIFADKIMANDPNVYYQLRDGLLSLNTFDYVLLDTPPDLRLETRLALFASSGYLVPIDADEYSYKGIVMLEREVQNLRKKLNPNLRLLGYVFNKIQPTRTHTQDNIQSYRKRFGDSILKTELRQSIRYAEARGLRLPITHHAASSEWAELYRQLANEIDL
jgi:chromosome partitioning protein